MQPAPFRWLISCSASPGVDATLSEVHRYFMKWAFCCAFIGIKGIKELRIPKYGAEISNLRPNLVRSGRSHWSKPRQSQLVPGSLQLPCQAPHRGPYEESTLHWPLVPCWQAQWLHLQCAASLSLPCCPTHPPASATSFPFSHPAGPR